MYEEQKIFAPFHPNWSCCILPSASLSLRLVGWDVEKILVKKHSEFQLHVAMSNSSCPSLGQYNTVSQTHDRPILFWGLENYSQFLTLDVQKVQILAVRFWILHAKLQRTCRWELDARIFSFLSMEKAIFTYYCNKRENPFNITIHWSPLPLACQLSINSQQC